ncbi:MAG TPA: SIMPL domain-containing protein [Mariprofundaceae bacterium]|nr:SIMPL domain-containing protein [Mariprofundaceae bacterium]
MKNRRITLGQVAIAFLIILLFLYSYNSHQQPPEEHAAGHQTAVYINATSNTRVPNDQVTILYRIEQTADDTAEIENRVNTISAEIDKVLRPFKADRQTLDRRIVKQRAPGKEHDEKQPQWTMIQQESITTTDLKKVSAIIRTIEHHRGLANGIRFGISRSAQEKICSGLVQKAIERFKQKAAGVARALGLASYRIESIHIDHNRPQPIRPAMLAATARTASPTLQSGTGEVKVSVHGRIDIPGRAYAVD